jgi:hypothetical protein
MAPFVKRRRFNITGNGYARTILIFSMSPFFKKQSLRKIGRTEGNCFGDQFSFFSGSEKGRCPVLQPSAGAGLSQMAA